MTEKDIYKKFLEKYGQEILTHWRSPAFKNMRWDIFGIFDLIVIWRSKFCNGKYATFEFIQLTELSNLSHRRNKINHFFKKIGQGIDNVSIFAYNKKKGEFKIEEIKYGDI